MLASHPLFDTALLLILAHLIGDYPLQSNWMVAQKRTAQGMAAHIAVHLALLAVALGQSPIFVLGLAAAHLIIDLIKVHQLPDRLWAYLADQATHGATIAAALWLGAESRWTLPPDLHAPLILLAGLILATLAGGPALTYLMTRYKEAAPRKGLPDAGRMIGLLERVLIFFMVQIDQPAGIGFLIAAKSILRFDTASQDQKASEYVIVGTLASFAWALAVAYGTQYALGLASP